MTTLSPSPTGAFADTLRYLAGRPDLERGRPGSTLSLDGIRILLDRLGHPDRRFPSILVAGTKGKGSTSAMIERGLRASGYRTGLYTQPDLHTIRERVRFDGETIAAEEFIEGIAAVREAAQETGANQPTFTTYEIMTAMALERFAARAVDVAVIEVGLGGRLDATNAVEAMVAVLTSISLDHTQILGNTVAAIAREKADIIKAGRPCVSAPQPPDAMAVIREIAAARDAELLIAQGTGAGWERTERDAWTLLTQRGRLENVRLSLRGAFQRINAAVAATALNAFGAESGRPIELDAIRAGLESTTWPGRFELVTTEPLTLVDGAHNVDSAGRLSEALAEEYPDHRPIYVVGIASDKDIPGIIHALSSRTGSANAAAAPIRIIATAARHPRAARPETIADAARSAGVDVSIAGSVREALNIARASAHDREIVVVTGSLHAVAEAREALGLAEASDELPFDPWKVA